MNLVNKYKKNKKTIIIVLLIIFSLHFLFRAWQYREGYLVKYDPRYWEKRYYESQWVVPNSKNAIGDDGLYAYAGYKYVFDSLNPILNSAEVPPLGKYLVGYTIFIFGNQNIFGLITGVISLAVLYFLNLNFFKNRIAAFLPVFVFSFDMLFWEQLMANYFDLLYLIFLMLTFIFTVKRKYILASIALGCFAATKFPPIAFIAGLTTISYVLLTVKKDIFKLLLSFTLVPLVFAITYLQFFLQGNNFIDFLKVLKYFLNYYTTGAKSQSYFMIFEMIFLGRWPTWWSGVLKVSEWHILWPISFFIYLFSFKYITAIKREPILIIIVWIMLYTVFLMLVPVAPRYLLLLIPFLYNVSAWILLQSTSRKYLR